MAARGPVADEGQDLCPSSYYLPAIQPPSSACCHGRSKGRKGKETPPQPPLQRGRRPPCSPWPQPRETQGPWGRRERAKACRRVTSPDSGGLPNDRGGAAMCTAGGLEGGGVEAAPLHDGKGGLSAVLAGGEEAT